MLVSTHYMDEAERCHRIAYIAYGKLLARGTVEEVVRGSGLVTWSVTGAHLNGLAARLTGRPGVDMVAPFGTTLHVSGSDGARLEESLAPFRADPGLQWTKGEASLEDVFIQLMGRAPDNFQ